MDEQLPLPVLVRLHFRPIVPAKMQKLQFKPKRKKKISTFRTLNISGWISIAECWRSLIVKQWIFQRFLRTMFVQCLPRWPYIIIVMMSAISQPIRMYNNRFTIAHVRLIDEDGIAECVLQHFANDTKFRGTFPTSFQRTTAWHAVAFTTNLHIIRNGLFDTK